MITLHMASAQKLERLRDYQNPLIRILTTTKEHNINQNICTWLHSDRGVQGGGGPGDHAPPPRFWTKSQLIW